MKNIDLITLIVLCLFFFTSYAGDDGVNHKSPNILFCISDDQSWLHMGAMGDPIVKTPAFDRVAKEGVLFMNAFADAPTCGPSRAAILTGQHIWRLRDAGNIHSRFPEDLVNYVDILKKEGYFTGSYAKGWGPGQVKTDQGWTSNTKENPAGKKFKDFEEFYKYKPKDQPFSFWLASYDPHPPYKINSGRESGMDPNKVIVPPVLPDNDIVRNNILDYYYEIERFDKTVMDVLELLEAAGELDNTIIVITSDNGMAFPRAKASLYDLGTHIPLAVRWPAKITDPNRKYDGFVTLSDLAPTFLEAAGLKVPNVMTGKSLMPIFLNIKDRNKAHREAAYTAMERHDGCRAGGKGYPSRALRTKDFLYIRNYEPERWAAGDPDPKNCAREIPFGEVAPGPTKTFLMDNESAHPKLYHLAFGKRPYEELYYLCEDPFQMNNLAADEKYSGIKNDLSDQLQQYTKETGDPRALGQIAPWDYYPYYGQISNKSWSVDELPN